MRAPQVQLVARWALVGGAVACGNSAAPQPEVVLVLDTDAPLVGELSLHPELSPDAAVDTVRVDILGGGDDVTDVRRFLVPELTGWPVSFGVVPPPDGQVRLRIRLFRARFASPGTLNGVAVLDPPPQVTIERLVHATASAGVQRLRVLLTEDCLGTASSFVSPETTCIDGNETAGSPTHGLEPVSSDDAPSVAGTWQPARETPCSSSPPPSALCIPGGFSIIGEPALAGESDTHGYDPIPLRPAVISPFFLDTTEYTVGRLRALLARTSLKGPLPVLSNGNDPATSNFCTWLGPMDPTNDRFPLNCLRLQTAQLICELEGGALPSEAQWEHAARGRGERRLYPWGDDDGTCCTASTSRASTPGFTFNCTGVGVEPVGSHPPRASCNGLGDLSRDGIVDMAGSLSEATADALDPYDAPCWTVAGILYDPVCADPMAPGHTSRGSNWFSDVNVTAPARFLWADSQSRAGGFRCAYRDKGSP
jgi:formylglycine-generating enzyme required for sulfatase activity